MTSSRDFAIKKMSRQSHKLESSSLRYTLKLKVHPPVLNIEDTGKAQTKLVMCAGSRKTVPK